MPKSLILLTLFLIGFKGAGTAQQNKADDKSDEIFLNNPSFEDTPHAGTRGGSSIDGWYDCGRQYFPNETAPDIHPGLDASLPYFNVRNKPYDGKTFLGLVVRENNSWESVGQRLSRALKAKKCYSFSIYLCKSDTYQSPVERDPNEQVPFTQPIQLRIWGGNNYCSRQELLASSSLVKNTNWVKYQFKFNPKQDFNYILLEAFYEMPILFPYNGNLLLDKASAIIEFDCDDPIASVEKKNPAPAKPKTNAAQATSSTPVVVKPAPKPEAAFSNLNIKELKEGQTIRIDKLFFAADSTNFSKESNPVLKELADFMRSNPKIVVEIGGHTNDIPENSYCDRLSTLRAKSIYDYLLSVGVQESRLKYKGYGKRMPLTTNKTAEGRKRNQRVEIKILSMNG
jgi:outer membrane protein OmpA-like peptidoglycan-associated protein